MRTGIKIIFWSVLILSFLALATKAALAQLPLVPTIPQELIVNVSYYEYTTEHSIKIYLDGKESAGGLFADVSPGKHTIKCVKTGYFDYEEEISFSEKGLVDCRMAKTTPLSVKVKDTSGSKADATVYLDDNFQGTMNAGSFPVAKGTHSVRCSSEGYQDFITSIEVTKHVVLSEGTYYNVDCILRPLPGTYAPEPYVPAPTPIPKSKVFLQVF